MSMRGSSRIIEGRSSGLGNSNIYYRYATPSEFGVARVNTGWHDDGDDRSGDVFIIELSESP